MLLPKTALAMGKAELGRKRYSPLSCPTLAANSHLSIKILGVEVPVAKASMEKLILQEEAARKSAALRMWVEKEAAAGLDQHKQ